MNDEHVSTHDAAADGRNYSLVDTYGADEAFLTGTFGAQTPVFQIDRRVIGGGVAGPVFQRVRALYKAKVAKEAL